MNNQQPSPFPPIEVTEAQPEDYPAVARLLAGGFPEGKYAVALGRDLEQRAALFEILLRHRALMEGIIYTVRAEGNGRIAATIAAKYENAPIPTERRRAARAEIAACVGGLRAWWAVFLLARLSSPKVKSASCYIDNLVVDPAFRRQHIGHRTVETLLDIARSRGKAEAHADIIVTNFKVRALTQMEGWEVVGRNFIAAPITLPLFGYWGFYALYKDLTAIETELER